MDTKSTPAFRDALLKMVTEAVKAGVITKADLKDVIDDNAIRPPYPGVGHGSAGGKR